MRLLTLLGKIAVVTALVWNPMLVQGEPGAAAEAAAEAAAPYEKAVIVGNLGEVQLTECSGLAVSRRRADLLWALNDGGNPATLFALSVTGAALGQVTVTGAKNVDWEDLASYRDAEGVNWLVIGDVGDNQGVRESVAIYFIKEPEVPPEGLVRVETVAVTKMLTVRYEDGPRDCESVAVDSRTGEVYLLSKRTKPPVLYRVEPGAGGEALARKVIEVPALSDADGFEHVSKSNSFLAKVTSVFGQPTAMDFAADGSAVAVLTYLRAYWFPKGPGETWADALAKPARPVDMPALAQGEALCFDSASRSLFISGEKLPTPLLRADRLKVSKPSKSASPPSPSDRE